MLIEAKSSLTVRHLLCCCWNLQWITWHLSHRHLMWFVSAFQDNRINDFVQFEMFYYNFIETYLRERFSASAIMLSRSVKYLYLIICAMSISNFLLNVADGAFVLLRSTPFFFFIGCLCWSIWSGDAAPKWIVRKSLKSYTSEYIEIAGRKRQTNGQRRKE